jgi:hypothetical protein
MAKTPTQIKSLARSHTETAVNVLAGIMNNQQENGPARVAAANSLLDRGWGKPSQPIAGDDDAPLRTIVEVSWKSSDDESK